MPNDMNEKAGKEERQAEAELYLKAADCFKNLAVTFEELSSLLKEEKKEEMQIEGLNNTAPVIEAAKPIIGENFAEKPATGVLTGVTPEVMPVNEFVPNSVVNEPLNNDMPKVHDSFLPKVNEVAVNTPTPVMPVSSVENTVGEENYIKEVHPAPEHLRNQRPATIPVQQIREQAMDPAARAL